MSERTYTESELQRRLDWARAAAKEAAWRDLMRRFHSTQRSHIANLLAHDWTITAVEMQSRYGGDPRRTEGTISLEKAREEMDAERERRRAGGKKA